MRKHKISQGFKYVNNLHFVVNVSQPNYCYNFTTIMHNYFTLYKPASVRFTLNEHVWVCVCVQICKWLNLKMKTYDLRTIFANTLGPNERVIYEHFVVLIKCL